MKFRGALNLISLRIFFSSSSKLIWHEQFKEKGCKNSKVRINSSKKSNLGIRFVLQVFWTFNGVGLIPALSGEMPMYLFTDLSQ
jgi:hypothetical protein